MALQAPLLEARGITVRFGGLVALRDASIDVRPGMITALIGPNGAGKSTLLDVCSGFRVPSYGEVRFRGRDLLRTASYKMAGLGVARTFQNVEVFARLTAAENVALAVPGRDGESVSTLLTRPRRSRASRAHALDRARELLEAVGIAKFADELAGELSYGVQKMLVLARLMATEAELLMLDEPGAGLARTSLDDLAGHMRALVAESGKTILFVDHNMQLVLDIADFVYVLHHGEVIAGGTPDEIRVNRRVADVYLSGETAPESETTEADIADAAQDPPAAGGNDDVLDTPTRGGLRG
jgi:ABC-type branched-subunit amino acid transport system ATPase component